jgi:hypothetical protein
MRVRLNESGVENSRRRRCGHGGRGWRSGGGSVGSRNATWNRNPLSSGESTANLRSGGTGKDTAVRADTEKKKGP